MNLLLFLGGTVNQSTWREELIPLLEFEDIAYFNPVVPHWDDEAFERELFIKSLPSTVELYVISKEMRGPYSVAEAVEASNKKPGKTIFLYIPEGMDEHQVKSLEATKKIIEKNGAYVANDLHDIIILFKGICYGFSPEQVHTKLASLRKAKKLSYSEIFTLTGINSLLENIYLDATDLSKTYIDVFYNGIKIFIKNPLFKDIDLNNESDLRFLRNADIFKEHIKSLFDDIKDKLVSRKSRVEKILISSESESEISLETIMQETSLDKVSLMFILNELKENKSIYDFNGRKVTLL